MDEPPLDLFDGLTGELAERLIREELPETALFGLRFRQNAARALLMPRPDPAKRTPLWLQRLRAKDLLQVARQFPDFPIVLETVRECLDDDLDLPRLRCFARRDRGGSGPGRSPGGRDPVAVHLGTDLPVHGGSSLRVGRAETERPPARGVGRRRRPARTLAARRPPRRLARSRRRSAGWRIACGAWAGRRAPPTRWPSICGCSAI